MCIGQQSSFVFQDRHGQDVNDNNNVPTSSLPPINDNIPGVVDEAVEIPGVDMGNADPFDEPNNNDSNVMPPAKEAFESNPPIVDAPNQPTHATEPGLLQL